MKSKTQREFMHRKFRKRFEASPTARKRIDKKKFYGVKINIKVYSKEIKDHFFNKKLLDQSLKGDGSLAQKMDFYFFKVRSTYDKLLKFADKQLRDSFIKGSKRVIDNSGDTIDLKEEVNETPVDFLVNQQTEYYDGITQAQSTKVNQIIQKGLDEGKTDEAVAKEIRNAVKKISDTRALRIARTEIVKTHTIGQVETMNQAGVEYYNYITSNDSKVAKVCRKHQGPKGRERIYKVALAGTPDNPLPVLNSHPNCRCAAVAYFKK